MSIPVNTVLPENIKRYEVMEVESYARGLGFSGTQTVKNRPKDPWVSDILIKLGTNGLYVLEMYDGSSDGISGINAWLSWQDYLKLNIEAKLASMYNSKYNYTNVGMNAFKEMLRTLDMIDGKLGYYGLEIYLNNWYNNATLESL